MCSLRSLLHKCSTPQKASELGVIRLLESNFEKEVVQMQKSIGWHLIYALLMLVLSSCQSFDPLNGGVQIKALPEDATVAISQESGNLCFEYDGKAQCEKGVPSYAWRDLEETTVLIECVRTFEMFTICTVRSQTAGPKGGTLADTRRSWGKIDCAWLKNDGNSVGTCKQAETEIERVLADKSNEIILQRKLREEQIILSAQRLKDFRLNPKAGDNVFKSLVSGTVANGFIVEIRSDIALVQYDIGYLGGDSLRWEKIITLYPY